METVNSAEKTLTENLNKCRCCFRMLIDDRKAVDLTESIRLQFLDLTQIKLLVSEIFADRICQLCASDLKVFSSLRDDLVSKQKTLYELAGLEEITFNPKFISSQIGESAQDEENMSEFDMHFETVEQDEDATIFVEEQTEQSDDASVEMEEPTTILKIEKIQYKPIAKQENIEIDEDGSTPFDFFEEIVGVESDDQTIYESEYLKEDELISCDLCGIELSKNHLLPHVEIMHKTFVCSQCNSKFQSKISLRRHMFESHGGDKNTRSKKRHFCPLCPKDYDYKKQLEDHIRSFHEKERNAECHICHKTFYHRDLKKHIEHVHGDKNVACETCGKLYTCVENLRLHMRYHQPPSFACSYEGCEKKFHQKVLWEHHEKKHTDIKPHTCEQCNAAFYSLRDLKRHCTRVHDKVTRKCFLCEHMFTRKDKFRLHLMKKHQELSEVDRENYLEQIRTMKWHE